MIIIIIQLFIWRIHRKMAKKKNPQSIIWRIKFF